MAVLSHNLSLIISHSVPLRGIHVESIRRTQGRTRQRKGNEKGSRVPQTDVTQNEEDQSKPASNDGEGDQKANVYCRV